MLLTPVGTTALLVSLREWLHRAVKDVSLFSHQYLFYLSPNLKDFAPYHPIAVLAFDAFLVFLLLRILVNLFPRRGIVVSLSELTAKPDIAAAANHSLTAELLHLLEEPEPVAVRGLQMNTWPGTDQPDQPAFGVVRPAQPMTPARDFSSSQFPMKLGVFEFGLDDAIRIIQALFAWPKRRTLVGWLSCEEGSAVVETTLIQRGYRRDSVRNLGPWRATANGKDARNRVLADIAAQVLVDTLGNTYTDSWQSLRACQDGIRSLRRAEVGFFDSSRGARRCFEEALEHDSGNWIARFYLALSLCGEEDGKPATALRHFQVLDDVLSRVAKDISFKERADLQLAERELRKTSGIHRLFSGLRVRSKAYIQSYRERSSSQRSPRLVALLDHLVRYPECPFILRYNIAIAMDELERTSGPKEALPTEMLAAWVDPLTSLEAIVALRDDPERCEFGEYSVFAKLLGPKERFELSLYALSAQAHIISRHNGAESEHKLREILKRVEATCEDARCLDRRIDSWRALETTTAVTLASLAHAQAAKEVLEADQEARQLLYRAIACAPHLVDAYLQLAKLYIRRKDEFAKNWMERARSLLKFAGEINPTCGTARLSELREIEELDRSRQHGGAASAIA